MARLESESKAGFYPTPPEEMELILRRITANKGDSISVLDPCCGKGDVLAQIEHHISTLKAIPEMYGIELEKSRAEEAKKKVKNILACAYENTRLSHDAFSMLYLNPPFMEYRGERAETTFFRDLTASDYIIPVGGLVVFNLPQYVLGDVAKLIATRLDQVRVYRFTDANYPVYKQVIVMGYRRATGMGRDKELETKLKIYAESGPEVLPELDNGDWESVQYILPVQKKPVELFQSTIVDIQDIRESMKQVHFEQKVMEKVTDVMLTSTVQLRPARALKVAHLSQAILSGKLPEHMGNHLLVGKTQTVRIDKSDTDPETGKMKDIQTFIQRSLCRVFAGDGIYDLK